jgi:hypothetical protein
MQVTLDKPCFAFIGKDGSVVVRVIEDVAEEELEFFLRKIRSFVPRSELAAANFIGINPPLTYCCVQEAHEYLIAAANKFADAIYDHDRDGEDARPLT